MTSVTRKIELTRRREARGWTKGELGRRARIDPARTGQIENGRVVPPPGSVELIRLARALDYPGDPAELLEPADSVDTDTD
jgi:transcriptional regulator with XRE-family HTH domain